MKYHRNAQVVALAHTLSHLNSVLSQSILLWTFLGSVDTVETQERELGAGGAQDRVSSRVRIIKKKWLRSYYKLYGLHQ